MLVDTEPFPINMIDFDGKEDLIRPNAVDKGKGKEVIIGDTRKADENDKNSRRKVVAERTSNGGETLKVTITSSNIGGSFRHRQETRCEHLFCASRTVLHTDADGSGHHRTVWIIPANSPATPRNHNNHVPSNHNDQK
jgi:hypothetical protein